MNKKLALDNDKYFCIELKGGAKLLSIHEKKSLSPEEYHPTDKNEMNDYQTLVKVEKTVGSKFQTLNLSPEPYQTYEFKSVSYKSINDFGLDGFCYDPKRKNVFYGWIYGIYAIKDGNDYYDVITEKKYLMELLRILKT